ncbi:hypothetical protein [Treponema brennaborense]|uniref:Uncharacterized protein n=1 Tax=Treponema brennaborense (strain DSM 12168 / CIP 105900 / DD5/3) TaxID=906968 RepID=F4LKX8_TREBD|nr:hypothetical protein [Treponema brennaborense]AEE16575.1 hypothetical protein Trebr_1147 [Treponema brennaborense DSM 12168]
MAIQPIDLQTLYSQLGNVAKTVVHQQQGAQLSNSIQQTELAKRTAEKNSTVQELSDEEKEIVMVKDRNLGSGSAADSRQQKERDADSRNEPEAPASETYFTDPDLGQHIDISG